MLFNNFLHKQNILMTGVLFITLVSVMFCTMGDVLMPVEAKPNAVTLYGLTRHDGTIYTKYTNEFVASHPEVSNILWLERSNPDSWRSAIESGSNPISILWGGGSSLHNVLADVGLMAPFQNTTLINYIKNNINDTIAGADMIRYNKTTGEILWVAAALSSFGFTVNHDNLDAYNLPMPETWEDLASPEYYLGTTQHAIGMGDAPETTSNTRVYQIVLQKFGWEAGWDILTRMAANSKIFEGGSGPTRDSVITGSQAISMTIDFYGYQAQYQNPSCEYIIPKNESIVNAEPIAIASSTPYQQYAEDFVQFVLSKKGQAMWLDSSINRLPVYYEAFNYAKDVLGNERTDLAEAFNKTVGGENIPFNETLAQSIYDIVTFYFQGALTRSSSQLYSAWDKLVSAYKNNEISTEEYRSLSRTMSKPKISLGDALTLQEAYAADPTIRDSLVTEYSTYAKSNYNKLANQITAEKGDGNNNGTYFDEFKIVEINPSEGDVVGGIVNITAGVVDYFEYSFLYGVTHVEFSVDGFVIANVTVPSSSINNISSYITTWDTTTYTNGTHKISVKAVEFSGRSVTDSFNILVNSSISPIPTTTTTTTTTTSTTTTTTTTINTTIFSTTTIDITTTTSTVPTIKTTAGYSLVVIFTTTLLIVVFRRNRH